MRSKDSRSSRATARRDSRSAGVAALVGEHPRESVALLTGAVATIIIFVNALFLQHGPHPSPIFATRHVAPAVQGHATRQSRTVETKASAPSPRTQAQIVTDIQRELAKRGFYDGVVDGVLGAKTDAALRDFAQSTGLKGDVDASEEMLRRISTSNIKAAPEKPRTDPIAKLLEPSKRILAVQRALSDFGYGQINPTGVFGPDTASAIERFERDRHLPITGKISDQLVRELAALTGRPLE